MSGSTAGATSGSGGGSTKGGLVLLGPANRTVAEALRERLVQGHRGLGTLELNFMDADGVTFRLTSESEQAGDGQGGARLTLQARVPNYAAQLTPHGIEQELREELGDLLVVPPPAAPDFDVALRVDAGQRQLDAAAVEEVIAKFARLRTTVQGALLKRALAALAQGQDPGAALRYDWRPRESLFVVPQADRVLVTLGLDLSGSDTADQAFARVFLQELVEAQRTVRGGPPCSFSKSPPPEICALGLVVGGQAKEGQTAAAAARAEGAPEAGENEGAATGYLTFTLFPAHVQDAAKRQRCVDLVLGFRSFLQYHLAAAKTHLHARMRRGAGGLLEVLKQGQPEAEVGGGGSGGKKTASGRTFVRR